MCSQDCGNMEGIVFSICILQPINGSNRRIGYRTHVLIADQKPRRTLSTIELCVTLDDQNEQRQIKQMNNLRSISSLNRLASQTREKKKEKIDSFSRSNASYCFNRAKLSFAGR